MATINDKRATQNAIGYVIFTDSFMSNLGREIGITRSLYALAINDLDHIDIVLANGKARSDMKRGRYVKTLRNVKLYPSDHLTIVDRHCASTWYMPNGF